MKISINLKYAIFVAAVSIQGTKYVSCPYFNNTFSACTKKIDHPTLLLNHQLHQKIHQKYQVLLYHTKRPSF